MSLKYEPASEPLILKKRSRRRRRRRVYGRGATV